MREITDPWFADVIADHERPCISIYLPVSRAPLPRDVDLVRFRDAVDRAQEMLSKTYDAKLVRGLIERLQSAKGDANLAGGGDRDVVAIFCSPDYLNVIDLEQDPRDPIQEHVVIGDHFYVKPLLRVLQTADRYQVLCVEIKEVRLYEGNRYRLDPVALKNVPQNPEVVSGMRLSHDVDSATDLLEADRQKNEGPGSPTEPPHFEQFFHAVDKAVWENHSRPSGLPLILCCAEKYHQVFRDLSRNPQLVPEGILLNPHHLPVERLREEAWKIMQPKYAASVDKLRDDFRAAKAHRKGSDELMEVAEATSQGRVGTLLVQSNVEIPGILHRNDGLVTQPDPTHPGEDVLDGLAGMVLKMDGRVVVLPPEAMPTETGVAAIYRY